MYSLEAIYSSNQTNTLNAVLRKRRESQTISVSIRNVLKAQSRESGSGFWIAYGGSSGETLSPSNLAVYVHARNNTGDPIKTSELFGSDESGRRWS